MSKIDKFRYPLLASFLLLFLAFSACRTTSKLVVGSEDRVLDWSGYSWKVKTGIEPMGPGPNYFTSDPSMVWVDEDGLLHLSIKKVNGKWYCSELVCTESLGYGKYSFYIASKVDQLDPNAVLGLFTWRDEGGQHNNEIDIELSRWGDPSAPNAQYVIQPYTIPGNILRFRFEQSGDYSTHEFVWLPDMVYFHSFHGHYSGLEDSPEIKSWIYPKNRIPKPDKTHVRINLWLNNQNGLRKAKELEVVIKSFKFTSIKELR